MSAHRGDTPYSIIQGDALQTLKTLPSGIVQCCVCSPPYFGLRDYLTATWEGGDAECDHVAPPRGGRGSSTLTSGGSSAPQERYIVKLDTAQYKNTCGKCGARRVDDQIGLEPTVEAYVAKLVEVFREVRRVMRDDSTLWLNLGDSYNGSGGAGGDYSAGGLKDGQPKYPGRNVTGLGPKQLLGIPWRVAFALQADGWILRSEVIWHKRAPMPESVQDRPTKAHEQLFLLAKSQTYYYDAEAIKEPATYGENRATFRGGGTYTNNNSFHNSTKVAGDGEIRERPETTSRNKRSVWTLGPESFSGWTQTSRLQPVERHDVSDDTNCKVSPDCPVHAGLFDWASTDSHDVRVGALLSRTSHKRSRRAPKPSFGSVQTVQQRGAETVDESSDVPHPPYSLFAIDHSNGSHKTAPDPVTNPPYTLSAESVDRIDGKQDRLDFDEPIPNKPSSNIRGGESPSSESTENLDRNVGSDMLPDSFVASLIPPECTCSFYHEITENTSHFATMPTKLVEPCILAGSKAGDLVLDPFCGSGTTLAVALKHGRRGLGLELNESYVELAHKRIASTQPMLFEVTA